MISKLRLEAEGTTLQEVLADIDAATKAAKLPKDLRVHDEHYERVHATLFKGRRVFGRGPSGPGANTAFQGFQGGSVRHFTAVNNTFTNATATAAPVKA